MKRQIVTKKDLQKMKKLADENPTTGSTSILKTEDDILDRVLKYIPAEVVAVYILVEGIILQGKQPKDISGVYWTVFFVLWILTPLYLWRVQKVEKATQLIVSFFAFAVWIFALGGPFVNLGWYEPIYGAVLLPIFTFAVGIINPEN